jgi:RNA polymerase sigma-70 factor (ECF subfamily)
MSQSQSAIRDAVESAYRDESRRVFSTLVRLLRDFDLAEEALHEAFAEALVRWPQEGIPNNPRAWLVSTGRFKAIDVLRRHGRLESLQPAIRERMAAIAASNDARATLEIEDDRLRLVFACCHPSIDRSVQVPLTLREVCGLTTEEIAEAFLTASTTMAQRIVRGKAKIRDAGIPFDVPSTEELPARLDSVLSVVYLVFNEGYSASSGQSLTRADLSGEAIRLGRLLVELMPDAEAIGLLALMLLHESRRGARQTPEGDLVLLEDQNRAEWDPSLIVEGQNLARQALASTSPGPYAFQSGIAAVHASSPSAAATDWNRIAALYDSLLVVSPSPVVELNRAVAIAMRDGPEAGLDQIEQIVSRGELADYHLLYAARADLLRRLDRRDAARSAYEQALALTRQEPERRFLMKRLSQI